MFSDRSEASPKLLAVFILAAAYVAATPEVNLRLKDKDAVPNHKFKYELKDTYLKKNKGDDHHHEFKEKDHHWEQNTIHHHEKPDVVNRSDSDVHHHAKPEVHHHHYYYPSHLLHSWNHHQSQDHHGHHTNHHVHHDDLRSDDNLRLLPFDDHRHDIQDPFQSGHDLHIPIHHELSSLLDRVVHGDHFFHDHAPPTHHRPSSHLPHHWPQVHHTVHNPIHPHSYQHHYPHRG
ncbi:hypothetical protein AAG570_006539 [Ranatra chinensis]|uniref:Histidine-rich glycoprotein n=1 Tax=Ranatra chinensis TaxID=642074 RepID=A0ABD0YUC8_9HEMI